MRERYRTLVDRFELMRELALILNRKRSKRGSIDFDMPEANIELDLAGQMTGVTRAERNIAHRLIEEFMLAANEAVASHLEQAGIPSLYRIHEMPDPKRVSEFEEMASHFGYSLGDRRAAGEAICGGEAPSRRTQDAARHRSAERKTSPSPRAIIRS